MAHSQAGIRNRLVFRRSMTSLPRPSITAFIRMEMTVIGAPKSS